MKDMIALCATSYRGEIFIGALHLDCWAAIEAKYPGITSVQARDHLIEGFVTHSGTFLNREDAKILAHELGIVRPGRDKFLDSKLWSEYLIHGVLPETGQAE